MPAPLDAYIWDFEDMPEEKPNLAGSIGHMVCMLLGIFICTFAAAGAIESTRVLLHAGTFTLLYSLLSALGAVIAYLSFLSRP